MSLNVGGDLHALDENYYSIARWDSAVADRSEQSFDFPVGAESSVYIHVMLKASAGVKAAFYSDQARECTRIAKTNSSDHAIFVETDEGVRRFILAIASQVERWESIQQEEPLFNKRSLAPKNGIRTQSDLSGNRAGEQRHPALVPLSAMDGRPQPQSGRAGRVASPLPKWRFTRVAQYIEANLAEPIKLADLAAEAGLSRMYFASQFRMATGLRPHIYLLQRRIERAQHQMISTSDTLVEIALSVGFQSQAHFTTTFRKLVGETPYRWRRARCIGA